MKAKTLNEGSHFQRGGDPKKSIGIGNKRFKDWEDYLEHIAKQRGEDKDELLREIESTYEGMPTDDFFSLMMSILSETPIEFQMEFMDEELELLYDE